MATLVISRPDPAEWPRIRAKWTVAKHEKGFVVTLMGRHFAPDAKPFLRKMDAEKQADANARSEMFDVLNGYPECKPEDFGI